jgi:prepilin peptidase CpaA
VLYYALLLAFPALVAFGGAYDLLTMTIPNRVSIALVALFLVVAVISGLSTQDILSHLTAGAIVLVAGIVLFAIGGFGGGDAKLLAAAALWIGLDQLVPFLTYVTLFGGVLAIAILLYRNSVLVHPRAPDWAVNLHKQGTGIPYGIAIASSALLIFPQTALFVVTVA